MSKTGGQCLTVFERVGNKALYQDEWLISLANFDDPLLTSLPLFLALREKVAERSEVG